MPNPVSNYEAALGALDAATFVADGPPTAAVAQVFALLAIADAVRALVIAISEEAAGARLDMS